MANKTLIIKMDPSATFTGGSTASSGIATYNNKIITGVGTGSTNLTLNFASSKISSRTFNKVFNINVKNKYESAKSKLQELFNEYNSMELYILANLTSAYNGTGAVTDYKLNRNILLENFPSTQETGYGAYCTYNSTINLDKTYTTSWVQTTCSKIINETNKTVTINSASISISVSGQSFAKMYYNSSNKYGSTTVANLSVSLQCVIDYLELKISSTQTSSGILSTITVASGPHTYVTLKCSDYRFKNTSGNILTTDGIQTILNKYK